VTQNIEESITLYEENKWRLYICSFFKLTNVLFTMTHSNRGDCGSCTINIAGNRVKACVGKVPPEPRLKSLQEKGLAIS
jgi:aerobic-type carbon monoxide dehydrogenase small subunit (CoxS/CutS family)